MADRDCAGRRQRNLASYHRRVAERRERGLCVKCGRRPPAPERSICASCGEKAKAADHARAARLRAERKPVRDPEATRNLELQISPVIPSRIYHSRHRLAACHIGDRAAG